MAKALEIGDKYLSGSLGGKEGIKLALFQNKDKKKPTDPDYVGSINLAFWTNTKKGTKEERIL